MKKEVATIKKAKTANDLQKSSLVKDSKTIKSIKVPKVKKDMTVHEFIVQPVVLFPVAFLLLLASLLILTTPISFDTNKTDAIVITPEVDTSFKIKNAIFTENSTTLSGVPYAISLKYPEILSSSLSAQLLSKQILTDIKNIAQAYVIKINEKVKNDDIEYSLSGKYSFVSTKDAAAEDVVIVTLSIQDMEKNKISINPEDNIITEIYKEYKFNITKDAIIPADQTITIINQ